MNFGRDVEELGGESLDVGMLYALNASREIIRAATDSQKYYCFICAQTDNKKSAVIYDSSSGFFQHNTPAFHSAEIIWFFNTKDFLRNLVESDPTVDAMKDGAKLSSPETRADLYAKTSSGKTVAFEIQQPRSGKQTPVRNRHRAYEAKNIHDQWIYSPHSPNPFFAYDYAHGLVADPYKTRLGIIAIKPNPLFATEKDSLIFAQADDKELAYTTKYVYWTNASDWSMSDAGLTPNVGSKAHNAVLAIKATQDEVTKNQNLKNAEAAQTFENHKDKAIERAKKRGIDPAKGQEVFIPPLEEPPYNSFPLSPGMMIEQGAYLAHMSPFDYIKNIIPSSNQWGAYESLRNRWEDTGKYAKSTFPPFESLRNTH